MLVFTTVLPTLVVPLVLAGAAEPQGPVIQDVTAELSATRIAAEVVTTLPLFREDVRVKLDGKTLVIYLTGAVIDGTPGDDILYGTDGPDVIRGYGGNDTIYAGNGPDLVHGGEGTDTIYGEGCDDTLEGDQDHDIVIGLGGTDILRGDRADDLLIGDSTDTFDGGAGNDDCWQTSTTAVYIVIYVYAGNPIPC